MARPLRIEFPGAIYHATSRMLSSSSRGLERLFRDDGDRHRFLTRLSEMVERYEVRLYLFTLMTNHYHLVLETPKANLSRFMQTLTTAYTVYFNKRHRRHGHLFDGRFKAKPVSGDDYLLKLSRYVHQNPAWVSDWVKKSIKERIEHLRRYRWSSYPGYIGKAGQWEFVEEAPLLAMTGGKGRERRKRYRQFVETGLAKGDKEFEEALRASPVGIGEDEFVQRMERLRRRKLRTSIVREDVAFRRVIEPLDWKIVRSIVSEGLGVEEGEFSVRRRDSPLRSVMARYLIRYAGLTQREVAQKLGMTTGASVSTQVARFEDLVGNDGKLARRVRAIERRLEQERERVAGVPED